MCGDIGITMITFPPQPSSMFGPPSGHSYPGIDIPTEAEMRDILDAIRAAFPPEQKDDPYAELKAAYAAGLSFQHLGWATGNWNDIDYKPVWSDPVERYRVKQEEPAKTDPYAALKEAYAAGSKTIQYLDRVAGEWHDLLLVPRWDAPPECYRVKPEPEAEPQAQPEEPTATNQKPQQGDNSRRKIPAEDYRTPATPAEACASDSETGQHAPGVKLDKGKPRAGLVLGGFSRALLAVADVGTFGAQKYTPHGWLSVPHGIERYTDAMVRHQLAEASGEQTDSESGLSHAAHAAWNALARLELLLAEAKAREAAKRA